MAAPALRIPVRANLDEFKKAMNDTSSLARTATRKVAQQFLEMNNEIAASAGAAGARWALGWAGKIALVVGSIKLMGDAISATRDQLKEMVDLSNKAQNFGISPSFLQSFTAETRKLQVGAEDLESALSHAFQATKDRAPIDLAKWETGEEQITAVEKALRVYNATVANGKLDGLVLFRDADTQEKKIQAVLKAMIQLEQIGQRAAALDLGERMFGSAFVDRIRQGRTSAESLLTTIQKASGDADGIFPDALVRRAKEMDDQLKIAHQRLSTALKPSWDDLANMMLTIKGYWADTIDLIAKAVELSNKIKIPGYSTAGLDDKIAEYRQVSDAIEGKGGGLYGSVKLPALNIPGVGKVLDSTEEKMIARRDQLQREIAEMSKGAQYGPFLPSQSRGTGAKPTLKPTGAETDRFETSADTIEKRTAALQAEAAAVDLGTAARERAKITAQLETVAKQANAAAGKGENVVTEEQRDRINEVANAYANAAQQIEKARVGSQIGFGQQTALLSPEDVAIAAQLKGIYPDVATALGSVEAAAMRTNAALQGISGVVSSQLTTGLTDILDGTKSVSQGFGDMSKAIIRAMEEAIIKMMVVGPLMRAMQGMMGGFGMGGMGGGIGGAIASALGLGGGAMSFGGDMGAGTGGMAFPTFHGGGIVGTEGGSRYMHASHWNDAPRFHTGIGPGERRAILQDGEGVFTAGQMKALGILAGGSGSGTPSITVNVIGAPAGTAATASTRKSGNGGLTIDVLMRQLEDGMAHAITGGQSPLNEALQIRYGLNPTRGVG